MNRTQNPLQMILSYLPPHLRAPLERSEASFAHTVHEITLRTDRPLCVYCAEKRFYLMQNGVLTERFSAEGLLGVTAAQLHEAVMKLCDFSVYSHQDELAHGYLAASGGLRVGLCGTAVMKDGQVANIYPVTTLSFRVPREVIGCSETLLSLIRPLSGALICGAPCSGKTTLIRDMARQLSFRYRVSIMDERGELAGSAGERFGYDTGLSDVYAAMPKGEAILCAVRSMAPDLIVCDELGNEADAAAVRYALRCGAACIATVHAASLDDLLSRPMMRDLLSTGAFRYLVFLSERRFSGRISRIYEWNAADG